MKPKIQQITYKTKAYISVRFEQLEMKACNKLSAFVIEATSDLIMSAFSTISYFF